VDRTGHPGRGPGDTRCGRIACTRPAADCQHPAAVSTSGTCLRPSTTSQVSSLTPCICTGGRLRSASIQRERVVVDVEFRCRAHARTKDGATEDLLNTRSRGGGPQSWLQPERAICVQLQFGGSDLGQARLRLVHEKKLLVSHRMCRKNVGRRFRILIKKQIT
jgi:hypothetical protein